MAAQVYMRRVIVCGRRVVVVGMNMFGFASMESSTVILDYERMPAYLDPDLGGLALQKLIRRVGNDLQDHMKNAGFARVPNVHRGAIANSLLDGAGKCGADIEEIVGPLPAESGGMRAEPLVDLPRRAILSESPNKVVLSSFANPPKRHRTHPKNFGLLLYAPSIILSESVLTRGG